MSRRRSRRRRREGLARSGSPTVPFTRSCAGTRAAPGSSRSRPGRSAVSVLGQDVADLDRDARASAVMMIPIPSGGVYESVYGLDEARRVSGIEEITISARPGQTLIPLPEGSRYLGFIFSRAETADIAEAAVREAHRRLQF